MKKQKYELKPCPFCGRHAHIAEIRTCLGVSYGVSCDDIENCIAGTPLGMYEEEELAIEAWNRRVTDE